MNSESIKRRFYAEKLVFDASWDLCGAVGLIIAQKVMLRLFSLFIHKKWKGFVFLW